MAPLPLTWRPVLMGVAFLAALSSLQAQAVRDPGPSRSAPPPRVEVPRSDPPPRTSDSSPRDRTPRDTPGGRGFSPSRTHSGSDATPGRRREVEPPVRGRAGVAATPSVPRARQTDGGPNRGPLIGERGGSRGRIRQLPPGALEHGQFFPYNRHRIYRSPFWIFGCHRWFFDRLPKSSFIQSYTIEEETTEIVAETPFYANAVAFAFAVPPDGTIRIDLEHPNVGWLAHTFVGKWGTPTAGMLNNLIKRNGAPATYHNVSGQPQYGYLVVSDPAGMSVRRPYRLTVSRSWKPSEATPIPHDPAIGIWLDANR